MIELQDDCSCHESYTGHIWSDKAAAASKNPALLNSWNTASASSFTAETGYC